MKATFYAAVGRKRFKGKCWSPSLTPARCRHGQVFVQDLANILVDFLERFDYNGTARLPPEDLKSLYDFVLTYIPYDESIVLRADQIRPLQVSLPSSRGLPGRGDLCIELSAERR
ncbi:hypothetical protein BDW75DRAFT_237485 [Aspergillus navahoensis]